MASTTVSRPHILAGKVVCADCGSVMKRSGLARDKKTYYLRCTLSSRTSRRECTPHCITQNKVENVIKENIQNLIKDALEGGYEQDVVNEALAKITNEECGKARTQRELSEVMTKINAIQKNIAMIYAEKLNGNISEEDFLSFRGIYEEEKKTFTKRKESLEEEISRYETRRNTYDTLYALYEKHKSMNELTHEVINDFVDMVTIGERDSETGEQKIFIQWLV